MTELELRYRRLLMWFPPEHRRQYGEEMIAVLLAGAATGQHRPGTRETADIIRSGMWLRLIDAPRAVRHGQWSAATAVFAFIGALVLASEHLRPVLASLAWGAEVAPVAITTAISIVWITCAVSIWRGWHAVAVVAALAAMLLPAVTPALLTTAEILLSVSIALTLLVTSAPRQAATILGPRRLAAFCALAFLAAVSVSFDATALGGDWNFHGFYPLPWRWFGPIAAAILTGCAVMGAVLVATLSGPVRRRLLALAAPAGAAAVVELPPYYLPGPAYVHLLVVPLVTLVVAVIWVQRRDRLVRLRELGREAELTPPARPTASS